MGDVTAPWAQPHDYQPGPRGWCQVCGYGVSQQVHGQVAGQTTVDGAIAEIDGEDARDE